MISGCVTNPLPDAAMVYSFNIELDFSKTDNVDECEELFWNYLSALMDSRQIISESHELCISGNKLFASVICPEETSLDPKNATVYGKRSRIRLEERPGARLQFIKTGTAVGWEKYVVPENSSFYFLMEHDISPLRCGDTGESIPLYKIPYTYHDNCCYHDVRNWIRDYDCVKRMWFRGSVSERFMQYQLQDHRSALSVAGRAVCKRIEELTGVPTYYYLFNYRAISQARDKKRRCPETGEAWFIEGGHPNELLDFKCDKSRLVSALTNNS